MDAFLIIAGVLLICFADREFASATFTSGTRISFRYPVIGVIIVLLGFVWI